MRNIFVIGPGRCGTKTFEQACRHMTNYTAGHETRHNVDILERLDYPERHIECDNRLSWMLGSLDRMYGNDAFYVYITRNPRDIARSHENRMSNPLSISNGYRDYIACCSNSKNEEVCQSYVLTIDDNIRSFMKYRDGIVIEIEKPVIEFQQFWERVGAAGNIDKAINEFSIKHNCTKHNS